MAIGHKLSTLIREHRNPKEGIAKAVATFREARQQGKITDEQISLREMAESLIGPNWASHLRNVTLGAGRLREAVDAVDASGFTQITGQLFVDKVKEKYKLATMVSDQMVTVIPNPNGNLYEHVVPYHSDVVDSPSALEDGQPYPATSFKAQFVHLAAPQRFGLIGRVTFNMIYSDLTGQALDSVNSVGSRVGLWVEEQRLRVALGVTNNYKWNGTTYNTFLTSGAYTNSLTDFTLTNWKSIQRMELLLAQMTDPVTGKAIDAEGKQLFVLPALRYTAKQIINATETRAGDITTGAGDQLVSANPLDGGYQILTSKHARIVINGTSPFTTAPIADSVALLGDFKKAFYWREVFPVQVVQAPPMSSAEFEQDVVVQVRANVYGVAGVYDPRYVIRGYNSSAT